MAANYRHAGLHWNNGPSKDARLYALPSPIILMLSTEARYRSADAFTRGKQLIYRAVPRVGHRPAELKYNASKIADECMLLWSEQPHDPSERVIFQALNEPTINTERGDDEDDFSNLDVRFKRLAKLESELEPELRRRLPSGTLLMSTPQVPDGRAYDRLSLWWDAANQYDVIGTHQYGPPEGVVSQVQWHLDTWPDRGVFLGEWHNNEPERTLQLLADLAAREPRFLGATWFIGHWFDAPSDWPTWKNLQDNDDLYSIFLHPPVVAQPEPAPVPVPIPPVEPPMPERDPYEFWTAVEIAAASGVAVSDVRAYWPKIHAQLVACGIADRPVQIAAIGTTAVESSMKPIHEYGTAADWAGYSGGPAYAGRGFVQLTHDYNYRQYGEYLAELWSHTSAPNMLVANPDLALDPDVAAAVLALYFVHHTTLQGYSIPEAARAGDWEWVRRLVQGGVVGLPKLIAIAGALGGTTVPTTVTYNAGTPAIAQNDPWSCSSTALRWALTALGRHPAESWIEDTMKAEGVVTEADGLLDATGKGLADFVTRQYGEFGFYANNEPSVTFDGVALEGGHAYPLLIGGRAWGHWSGCSGYDAGRDVLLLANPAEGWMGIGQTMNRGLFASLGPFSMVRVLHPDLLAALPPEPIPVPIPQPSRSQVLLAEIRTRLDELERLTA